MKVTYDDMLNLWCLRSGASVRFFKERRQWKNRRVNRLWCRKSSKGCRAYPATWRCKVQKGLLLRFNGLDNVATLLDNEEARVIILKAKRYAGTCWSLRIQDIPIFFLGLVQLNVVFDSDLRYISCATFARLFA